MCSSTKSSLDSKYSNSERTSDSLKVLGNRLLPFLFIFGFRFITKQGARAQIVGRRHVEARARATTVVPAKAGTHVFSHGLDSRLRGNDGKGLAHRGRRSMIARPGEDQISKAGRVVEDFQAAPVEIIVLAGRGVFPVNAEIYSDARPDFGREADFTPGHGDFDDVVIVIKDFHRVARRSGPFWVGRARGRSPVVIYGIEDIDVVGKIVGEKLPFGCAPFDCAPFGCAQGLRQGARLGAMEAGVNEELHAVVFPELVAVVLADHGAELGA